MLVITDNRTVEVESSSVNADRLISFSEQERLLKSIRALIKGIDDETRQQELNAVIENIHDNVDKTEIDASLIAILSKLIRGNAEQSLQAGTTAFFMGFAASIASASTINQTSLNDAYKTLFIGLSAISAGFGRLQLGIEVNKNGGSRRTSQLLLASLLGLAITVIIAESSNPKTINSLSDYRTIGLILGALLSGFGISTFSQVSNVINWHLEAGKPSAKLGGIAGMAPGIVGLIRFGLLVSFGEKLGQTITSSLLITSLAITTSVLTYSKNFSLVNAPCHQLMNHYDLSMQDAIFLAEIYGQKFFPTESAHGDWQALAHQLKNSKVLLLITNYIFCFGGFLGMTASLNLALTSWGYDANQASLITSLFSLWASLCRAMIAFPINFLEKDRWGGGITNSIGAMLVLASALSIAIPNKVPEFNTLIPALSFMAIGFGISSAATFKCVSSEVHKELSQPTKTPIVTAKANALISCIGTFGSVIYTMGGGQLAEQNHDHPELGYVQIFYAIAALALLAGIPVFLMSHAHRDVLIAEQALSERSIVPEKSTTQRHTFFSDKKPIKENNIEMNRTDYHLSSTA